MRLDDLNHTHKKKSVFNQINKMAHKRKYFKMTLKNVAAMTVGTDLRKIWRGGRKDRHRSGICLKDAPSKNGF
jgi:hypothetical protein